MQTDYQRIELVKLPAFYLIIYKTLTLKIQGLIMPYP
jgi:hypothetical protein